MKGHIYLKNTKGKASPSFRFENKEHRMKLMSDLSFKYSVKSEKEFLCLMLNEHDHFVSGKIRFYSKNKLYKNARYESAQKRQELIDNYTKSINDCSYVICPDFQ
jgi:hypothetical protein